MSKSKFNRYVYSVFSPDIQDYPYFPFISSSHSEALTRFLKFIESKDSICNGAVLHCIGTCKVDDNGIIIDGSLQPFVVPCEVEFRDNVFSRLLLLSYSLQHVLRNYLTKLNLNYRKEKEKCQKMKKVQEK